MKKIIISLNFLFICQTAFSRVITVDDYGQNADYYYIQDAILYANNGDTVYVYAGTYIECIDMLGKSITLLGEKQRYRKTIIKSNNKYPFTISLVKNSTIKNLYIQDGETGIVFHSGKIINCQIMNNKVGIKYEFSFLEQDTYHNEFRNNTLINNEIGIDFVVYNVDYSYLSKIIANNIIGNKIGLCFTPTAPLSLGFEGCMSVDAQYNWWGTLERDSIASTIWDKMDYEKAIALIDFENWLDSPIAGNMLHLIQDTTTGIHRNNIYNNIDYNIYAYGGWSNVKVLENISSTKIFSLSQNYPNPFNPITTIKYMLYRKNHVSLKIFHISGQELETLINEFQLSGEHEIKWHPKGLPSGIYFYKIQVGEFLETKKLVFCK